VHSSWLRALSAPSRLHAARRSATAAAVITAGSLPSGRRPARAFLLHPFFDLDGPRLVRRPMSANRQRALRLDRHEAT